jgi:hypothetical protein
MRVLLDERIDERFRNYLPGHDCQSARYAGLAGLKNGDLPTAAEKAQFDVFLTVDQGIEYQQNLTGRSIGIIIFRTKSNRLKDLLPHVSTFLAHIESIQLGQMVRIQGWVNLVEASSKKHTGRREPPHFACANRFPNSAPAKTGSTKRFAKISITVPASTTSPNRCVGGKLESAKIAKPAPITTSE